MKRLLIAATLLMPLPAAAADKSAAYSEAFCAGFNAAVQLEAHRAANWRAMTLAASGEADPEKQSNVAKMISIIVNSVPIYVLLQPLTGRVEVPGGDFVDCTPPKPPAATAPAKK